MVNEQKNISLRALNTFGIDVRCDRLVEFADAADLRTVFADGSVAAGRWAVISGGSNIIFTDDFHGTLLRPIGQGIDVVADGQTTVRVRVAAGVEWDRFVEWAVEQGLWGAENLSYIPGLVGAAPVQNIGAYGVEAKDLIHSVEMYDVPSGKMVTLCGEHCGFGYRDSVFKRDLRGRVVITAVDFVLTREAAPRLGYGDLEAEVARRGGATLRNIRDAVTAIRRSKLPEPDEMGNAGSFFKNPVVPDAVAQTIRGQHPDMPSYPSGREGCTKLAAGWLIDQCGWKGRALGRVGVHARQALVLVNLGGATGHEVIDLAHRIQNDVEDKFGVQIEMEVNVL
ncbi:UDP-N-acetylmuramate dehydrogenase [Alistipes sp. OttesenSCG-928-B03]|nr:UDP-N-acetylmuramate dehydrogenase [Alistipes sp. OttesenSCG-928-B03]